MIADGTSAELPGPWLRFGFQTFPRLRVDHRQHLARGFRRAKLRRSPSKAEIVMLGPPVKNVTGAVATKLRLAASWITAGTYSALLLSKSWITHAGAASLVSALQVICWMRSFLPAPGPAKLSMQIFDPGQFLLWPSWKSAAHANDETSIAVANAQLYDRVRVIKHSLNYGKLIQLSPNIITY